ncbi:MAG: hypothetical protein WBS24_12805 [Terriglobales bacterium]
MTVSLNPSALKGIRWYEYASRFLIGGATTAIAGLIANKWGPGIGAIPRFSSHLSGQRHLN